MEQIRENYKNRYSLLYWILISIFLVFSVSINAQTEKKYIRQGNRAYEKNNFSESEIAYRRAIDKNKQIPDAVFNIGDALYKQKKYEDAGKQFIENANLNEDMGKKAAAYFNLGNSLLNANKLKESIDAYKGSLKLRPESIEAKYNLAYAQDLLKKQEEQQQKDQNNKDQNKDEKKDNQNKDQKDQSEKEKNKDQQNDPKNQQEQQQEQNISKEDAERLLNSIANDEKKVQEKVKLAKAAKTKVRTVKNW